MAKNKKEIKVPFNLSVNELDGIIEYLFTESPLIRRKQIKNIQKMFKIIDERVFEQDDELMARIDFIQRVVDAKLEQRLTSYKLIITHVYQTVPKNFKKIIKEVIVPMLNQGNELTEKEIEFIDRTVTNDLNYSFIFSRKNTINDIMERLEIGDYDDLKKLMEEAKTTFQQVLRNIRSIDSDEKENLPFSFLSRNFKEELDKEVSELKKPTRFLQTGMQGLNLMLGNGFESGRCYLFLGAPSSGKSILLLSLAYQIAKHNQELECVNPNKRKCVIYLTQENSKKETLERLWNIAVSNDNIRNYSIEEIENVFRNYLPFSEESKCDLRIYYRKNKIISTDDIYSLIQEAEDDGFEVIALVQDYAKRIRPSYMTGDLRIDLGSVIDEFCVLAKDKDIPVITASQINRVGVSKIEAALQDKEEDIVKKLSTADIGESFLMVENADFVAINNKEFKETLSQWFLTSNLVKDRSNKSKLSYFAHPTDKEIKIRYLEDINDEKPIYRESISDLKNSEINFEEENISKRGRKMLGGKIKKGNLNNTKKENKKEKKENKKINDIEEVEELSELMV